MLSLSKYPFMLIFFLLTLRQMFMFGLREHVNSVALNASLVAAGITDELTQIANRKGFNQALGRNIDQAQRFGVPFCLLIADIDYFKQYNDSLGYPAGDACLKRFSQLLATFMGRKTDFVARIGGEEFALLFVGSESQDVAGRLDTLLQEVDALRLPHPDSLVSDFVSASFGLVQYRAGESMAKLYQQADQALYLAKQNGRRCYQVAKHDDASLCPSN